MGGWGGVAGRLAPGLQALCRTVGTPGRRPLGSCVSWGGTPAPASTVGGQVLVWREGPWVRVVSAVLP